MTDEQFIEINKTIAETIKTTVNGKIDKLNVKIDNYIVTDNEWKQQANPTIELGNNIRGFGKVAIYILGFAGMVFGIIKGINK